MLFNSIPANLNALFPSDGSDHLEHRRHPALDVREFDQNFHAGDWSIDIPRPTWAVWIGDNWRVDEQPHRQLRRALGRGLGRRVAARRHHQLHPDQQRRARRPRSAWPAPTSATRTTSATTTTSRRASASPTTSAARTTSSIRGGTGLYYTTPVSNMTFSPQIYSQMVTAAFLPPASGLCQRLGVHHQSVVRRRRRSTRRRPRRRRSRRASSARTIRTRTPGRAASASRSRSTR